MTQQTTTIEQPELEQKQKEKDLMVVKLIKKRQMVVN